MTGIHCRSKNLIEATRSFDRKRIGEQDLKTAFEKDAIELISLQKKAGFSYISDGMLKWNDLFRPFSENIPGIEVGAITRFFETNTFYKKPIVNSKIDSRGEFLEKYFFWEFFPKNAKIKAILPSPYTFANLAENKAYSSSEELMFSFARILNNSAKFLEKKGVSLIQFSEPALAYNATFGKISREELVSAKEAIAVATRGVKAKTMLHAYFGNFSKLCPEILNAEVDVFGIDFCQTSLRELKGNNFLRQVALGLVDSQNSIVEKPAGLKKFAEEISKALDLREFFLCPTLDLDFVPHKIAVKKLESLGKAAKSLKVKFK